jgi:hypothetical protein
VAKAALAAISNEMVNVGYVSKTRTDTTAIFEKTMVGGEAFLVNPLGKSARRVSYVIIESDTNTRILATFSIVAYPTADNPVESSFDRDHTAESLQWQQLLERVKQKFDRR